MNFNDVNRHKRDGLISFDPSQHIYRFGDEEFESVTTVVENLFAKFDARAAAMRKCGGDEAMALRLMADWEEKGRQARDLGTLMHDRIERHYLGEVLEPEVHTDPTFSHFMRFAADRPLRPYRSEWRIFSERFKIAGTLDFLSLTPEGEFEIYDWKRSTKVVDAAGRVIDNSYHRTADYPLGGLADTTFNHYALQVSIYRFILAEHYGINVSRAYLGVFHPDMPRHYCVELPYMGEEVDKLLNYRLKCLCHSNS